MCRGRRLERLAGSSTRALRSVFAGAPEATMREELDEAKRALGCRHGGFNAQDKRALHALERREQGQADAADKGRKWKRASVGKRTQETFNGLAFRCEMLVTRWCKSWRTLTCDDEDDFLAVKRHAWCVREDFLEGEPVELWRIDAKGPPRLSSQHGISGYARSGIVLKQKLARPEPRESEQDVQARRRGRPKTFRDNSITDDGVVLRLEANEEKGWEEEREVHYDGV